MNRKWISLRSNLTKIVWKSGGGHRSFKIKTRSHFWRIVGIIQMESLCQGYATASAKVQEHFYFFTSSSTQIKIERIVWSFKKAAFATNHCEYSHVHLQTTNVSYILNCQFLTIKHSVEEIVSIDLSLVFTVAAH